MWQSLEPLGAHQGVQPLSLRLEMLLAGHLQVLAVGSPEHPPLETISGWPCIHEDP